MSDFTVSMIEENQTGSHPVLTVRVPVNKDGPADAIKRITSVSIKDEVVRVAGSNFGLTNHGVQNSGGYRPVHVDGDRAKPVVAYERDFKFTRNI